MSSLEKLKQALEEEAAGDIAAILAEADKRISAIEAGAQAEAQRARVEILANAEKDRAELKRKAEAEANLIRRRVMLTSKASLVDAVMHTARDLLADLPSDRYRSMLVALIVTAAQAEESVQVVLNENDRARFGKGLLAEAESRLREQGRHTSLQMSAEPGTMSGGFRLVGSQSEVDSTFERLLHMAGESLEPEIARILFTDAR